MGLNVREVTSGFWHLGLFFRQESCEGDNVCVDVLLSHGGSTVVLVSGHDVDVLRLFSTEGICAYSSGGEIKLVLGRDGPVYNNAQPRFNGESRKTRAPIDVR